MVVRVDATEQYADWFEGELSTDEQMAVVTLVKMLQDLGVLLDHPYSSKVWDSRFALRELRAHHGSTAIRVFYVFAPWRGAVLLIGGKKGGSLDEKRFYKKLVPQADKIWERYLAKLEAKDGKGNFEKSGDKKPKGSKAKHRK